MNSTANVFLIRGLLFLCVLFGLSQNAHAKKETSSKRQRVHQEIIKATPLYQDEALSAYVNQVGQSLVKNSDQPKRKFNFYVLDDGGINAFTPGYGLIYINRGILALMNSEAELAGVLAHEIGHNTGNHLGRRKTQSILSNVAATAAAVVTGSNSLGNSISLVSQARISGLGREMELEADEYAALYMYQTNYDPNQMLGVLGVLKDHEHFTRSKRKGKKTTYHGTFSTHPRSDKRLKEVIKKAGVLPPGESFVGRGELRSAIKGMVYGENFDGNQVQGKERFASKGLGVTFTYPDTWSKTNKGRSLILKDAAQTVQMKIQVMKNKDKAASSESLLQKKYPKGLTKITRTHTKTKRDVGTMARYGQERVAVIKLGRNVYYCQGIARDNSLSAAEDADFVSIIKSFRRVSRKDFATKNVHRIYFTRLEPGQTFADLAKGSPLGADAEAELRLLNGYYPKGEPEPGMWVKIVRADESADD